MTIAQLARILAMGAVAVAAQATAVAPARAGQFAALQAGASVLKQEGHAPPLCCRERETWTAPGGRLAAQLGYAFSGPFLVRAEVGLGLYQVAGADHLDLRVLSPDAAAYAGLRLRSQRLVYEILAGGGWRHYSGKAHDQTGGGFDSDVSRSAADLRLALGVHAPLGDGHRLGGELMVAKVMIAETVGTLSLTYTWGE